MRSEAMEQKPPQLLLYVIVFSDEAEKDSFIALPSKRRHTGFCFERLCVPTLEEIFFFWPCNPARVVPRPGIKFTPPALEAQSFNH